MDKAPDKKFIRGGGGAPADAGFREHGRETSRSVGFNPRAQQVMILLRRAPEALDLGPAVISCRRRYHCPSFGCLLNRSRDCRLAFASLRRRRPFSVWELRAPPSRGQG